MSEEKKEALQMETLVQLIDTIRDAQEEMYKDFDVIVSTSGRGKKSAAARARKATLALAKLYKEFRKTSIATL